MRPTLDEYFISISKNVSQLSTCERHHVGAVIAKDKHILTTGYNGAPKGTAHCTDIGCVRIKENIPSGTHQEKCRAVHAEQNAIIQAAYHGVSIAGGTLYCTHQPCILCAKMIINSGIQRVVYLQDYPDVDSLEMLSEAGIVVEKIEEK